jgi:hypothetical protein
MISGDQLRHIVSTGARTLVDLWVEDESAFKRSSDSPSTGSTTSPRAIFALLDAVVYSDTHDQLLALEDRQQIVACLLTRAHVLHDKKQFEQQRQSDINKTNSFTDSQLAIESRVLSLVGATERRGHLDAALMPLPRGTIAALERRSRAVARERTGEFESSESGNLADQPHDFVTYFGQRALDICDMSELNERLVDRVQRSVLQQIGHYRAGSFARFDLGALLFGVALLQRAGRYHEPTIAEGLRITLECQAKDGSWPILRTISDGARTLFISSYELALAIANLILQRLHFVPPDQCKDLADAVERVVGLASIEQRNICHGGWANDRNPAPNIVEGWTTAVVVSLAVRYNDVLSMTHTLRCFDRYDPDSRPHLPAPSWPDLCRFRRLAMKRVRLSTLSLRISDPTEGGGLARELRDGIVAPVLRHWAELPDRHGVSILLPGDPGTRKTTLVQEIARAVDWPLLTLSPPVFLRGGLERFESEAAEIFRDLQLLSRVVVFFDECEEFFRKRPRSELAAASRTVGAFITAGMLPRLQALHDRGRVIFVVATNALLEELDDAATRPGRFDIKVPMLHPAEKAQLRYLKDTLSEKAGRQSQELVRSYSRAVRDAGKVEDLDRIPFGRLDRIAAYLVAEGDISADALIELSSKD